MIEKKIDELAVKVYETREIMGAEAAREAAECILACLEKKETINCIFAAAPSQNEFLKELVSDKRIPWNRINGFHMDEYVGLPVKDSRSFSGYLSSVVFDKVPFRSVHLLNGMAETEEETRRYSQLLEENPTDIVFMGVGENGHIAFNDPSAADFQDKSLVKEVVLEEVCRRQQVNDGCFPELKAVPKKALTVTVPGLMRSAHVFCIVPNERKAEAVKRMLTGAISEDCPASILRRKQGAKLYLDQDSAAFL
ncbi:MAG: 6-phosphogluconolactonase [Lachnospiraceae bacterium]|nr:6-phosphogluconolactonase [Lachnospiraceae bacterium]